MKTKTNKTIKRVKRTQKVIYNYFTNQIKIYNTMKKNLAKIWACLTLAVICTAIASCNVTRTITNQSEYYQRGDTSVVIQTKTIETYDATKKGF